MKILIITLLFLSFSSIAQDSISSFSVYFKNDYFKDFKQLNDLTNTTYLGEYELIPNNHNTMRITAGDKLIIGERGIYIAKNKLLSISREEVRENSKYRVKNSYLHGVITNDSIPVIIEDDSYYFLMPTKTYLFDNENTAQSLWKTPTDFLIYTKENNGYFSILKLNFSANNLSLSELDVSHKKILNLKHSTLSNSSIPTFILNPTKKDWPVLLNEFIIYDNYSKVK